MVTTIKTTHYALAKRKTVEKNAVKVLSGLKTVIVHARVTSSAARTTLIRLTRSIANAIRQRSVAQVKTDALMSYAFRPKVKIPAAQVRHILKTEAADAKVTRHAARMILTQLIRNVFVTLTPLAAMRHPSSKHGSITLNALRVKAATNAVMAITIRRTRDVSANQKMNAVRTTPGKRIPGVYATHLKIAVKVIHTQKTNTVHATRTFLVAKNLPILLLTGATVIAPARVVLIAVIGAVTKMTGALTRTVLACLTWTKTNAVAMALSGLKTTNLKKAAALPVTVHAATLPRIKLARQCHHAITLMTRLHFKNARSNSPLGE
jgi:hypothetical protein